MQGYRGKVYYKSAVLTAAPDKNGWTELLGARDVTPAHSRGEIDATTKDGSWEANEVGKLKSTISLQLKYTPADAGYLVLYAAFISDSGAVAFAVLDGAIATGRGMGGNWVITEFGHPQPVDGLMVVDITLRPHSHMGWIT